MDYTLAALKVVCTQLKDARQAASRKALTLGGILFQRVWSQGILVSKHSHDTLILDDGTGLFRLNLTGEFLHRPWDLGISSSLRQFSSPIEFYFVQFKF